MVTLAGIVRDGCSLYRFYLSWFLMKHQKNWAVLADKEDSPVFIQVDSLMISNRIRTYWIFLFFWILNTPFGFGNVKNNISFSEIFFWSYFPAAEIQMGLNLFIIFFMAYYMFVTITSSYFQDFPFHSWLNNAEETQK